MTQANPAITFMLAFRIGYKLKHLIEDAAITKGVSQNAWLVEAVEELIERGEPIGTNVTAALLLHEKVPSMVRVPPFLLELINDYCDERAMPRTVFLLDAVLTKLALNGHNR